MNVEVNFDSLGGGGIDLANAVYTNFTWAGSQPLNLSTPNGKAKALIGVTNGSICFFVADGVNDNYAMEDGVKNPNRTYSFNANSVTSSSAISSGNTDMKVYIIY